MFRKILMIFSIRRFKSTLEQNINIPSSLRRYRLTKPVDPNTVTVRPLLDDRPPFPYFAKWLNCLPWEAKEFRTTDMFARKLLNKMDWSFRNELETQDECGRLHPGFSLVHGHSHSAAGLPIKFQIIQTLSSDDDTHSRL